MCYDLIKDTPHVIVLKLNQLDKLLHLSHQQKHIVLISSVSLVFNMHLSQFAEQLIHLYDSLKFLVRVRHLSIDSIPLVDKVLILSIPTL